MIAGKMPLAVSKAEWGIWFFIGPLLGIAGIAGMVFACKAFARRGQRTLTVAIICNALRRLQLPQSCRREFFRVAGPREIVQKFPRRCVIF